MHVKDICITIHICEAPTIEAPLPIGKITSPEANMRALSAFAEWLRKPGSRDFKKESKTNFAPISSD